MYRYYKNPEPTVNATIVMLAGGTGLGDGFFAFAKDFMKKYSLINFNYPMGYKNNEQLSDAIAELIKYLKAENVYFWGQSYGGALAQIIAKRHPEVVKGLILTSTASMSNHIRFEGMQCLVNMFNEKKEEKDIKLYKRLPMALLPGILNLAFKKHLKGDRGAQEAVKELLKQLKPDLTQEYFCHMTHLLCDLRNYLGTCEDRDYAYLKGRVLIIEPDDDEKMEETVESIRKYGVINPGIARPRKGGGYELISGHRRKRALAEMHKLMDQETNKKKTEFDEKFENEEWLPEALELAEKKDNLSSFYRWLEDENYIFKSPLRRIYKIKTRKVVKEAFTDEKIEILQYGLNQVE